MQYFVSIENSNYFHWQIELLIESFKKHKLQDDLIIYVAESVLKSVPESCKNLLNHKNKIFHKNFGKDYVQSNRIYSLYQAVVDGILKDDFVVLHSDMILKNPVNNYNLPFTIVMNSDYEKDKIVDGFCNNEDFICNMPIIFNKLEPKFKQIFFSNLVLNLEKIIKEKGVEFPCEKAAWKLSFLQGLGYYSYGGKYLTCSLLHPDIDVPFIHYNHGIPPDFNKRLFKYFENPYEKLLEYNPTESSDYFNKIIKSYIN